MIKQSIKNILKYGVLILWCFIVFFPLLTIFFGAFKTYEEFITTSGVTLPHSFLNLENFKRAFIEGKMLIGFINTFILVALSIIGSIIIGSMTAYVICRFDFKFKKTLLFLYLVVSIMPLEIAQVATFKLIYKMGIYNTIFAPVIIYIGADMVTLYIYMQAFEKLPKSLDKAARLEGASYFRIYTQIILPLLKPASATIALLKLISVYNDFYIPYLYMPSSKLSTVSTALYRFVGPNQIHWQVVSAAILISMLPMMLMFLFLQKYIYKGMTAGSVN